jgi:steroid 5-alpha reductase family enzyme
MSYEGDVVVDWLVTLWGYLYWKIAVSKFGFWLVSLAIKNLGTVDFVYCFNHWLIGILLFAISLENTFYVKPLILFIALTIWFFRLGGFILFGRILK